MTAPAMPDAEAEFEVRVATSDGGHRCEEEQAERHVDYPFGQISKVRAECGRRHAAQRVGATGAPSISFHTR